MPGYINFAKDGRGDFQFGYVRCDIDWQETVRDQEPAVEFSFKSMDEMDPCSGWAAIENGRLEGISISSGAMSQASKGKDSNNFISIKLINGKYRHIQRSPLCLLLYSAAIMFLVLGWGLRNEPVIQWIFSPVGLLMLVVAGSFHYLIVKDDGDRLAISFGPIPLFRRSIKYQNIEGVEIGRTTILDGWGIHMSIKSGWVWSIWGRSCVVLRLRKGILRIGTDDAEQLADFLNARATRPSIEEHRT